MLHAHVMASFFPISGKSKLQRILASEGINVHSTPYVFGRQWATPCNSRCYLLHTKEEQRKEVMPL